MCNGAHKRMYILYMYGKLMMWARKQCKMKNIIECTNSVISIRNVHKRYI